MISTLAQEGWVIESLGFWGWGAIIATVVVITTSIAGTIKHTASERTRREIAAYIAEGAMTPEQGEKILRARTAAVDAEEEA
jgi:hypothetical protein